MQKNKQLVILILIVAAFLRLWGLERGDAATDEVLYAFRAVGMLDFDEAEDQTTPLEWFDGEIPWWTKLSFHDHPPLVFFVQHIFMRIFGENNFAFRLPSALLGIASIYLIYLIGALLYSETVGLISAAILALTVNHIYISRVGLQESYVIFFMLLATYFFLKALRRDAYFLWAGIALGLAALTKYTTFVLVPIFLIYLLFFRRDYFLNKKLWIGALVALFLFSPVILYNFQLYRAVGHFDFQFSYMFGQNPEVWQVAPGKDIGILGERIHRYIPALVKANSWMLLSVFAVSIALFFVLLLRNIRDTLRKHGFLLISIPLLFLLVLRVGPSYRFLAMLTPFIVFVSALFFAPIFQKKKTAFVILGLFLLFEAAYSINSQVFYYAKGPPLWAYSLGTRTERYSGGYNELAEFLEEELKDKRPVQVFEMSYQFLEELHEKAIAKALREKLEPYSAVFIYDGNVDHMAQLWVLDRLNIYHAWPVVKTEQYMAYAEANGIEDLTNAGFENYYFITPTEYVYRRDPESWTVFGPRFEELLIKKGITPLSIKNKRGEEAFRVYKF